MFVGLKLYFPGSFFRFNSHTLSGLQLKNTAFLFNENLVFQKLSICRANDSFEQINSRIVK